MYIQGMAQDTAKSVPASLFYDDSRKYSVGELQLHLILEEQHAIDATVTEHPVQDGSVISDHISVALREGSLRGLVSNHAIALSTSDGKRREWRTNYALAAWNTLRDIADRKELVTVVTVLETYRDVAITHVGTMRDGGTGDALEFDIRFKQVRRVRLTEDVITASVSPESMDSDIDRVVAADIDSGHVTADGREYSFKGQEN